MKLEGNYDKFSNNDLNDYDSNKQPPELDIKDKIEDLIDALPKDNLDPEMVESLKQGGLTLDQLLLILMSINPNAINLASQGNGDLLAELITNASKSSANVNLLAETLQDETLLFRNDLNSNIVDPAKLTGQQSVQSMAGAQLADQLRAEMAKSLPQEFGTKIQVNGNMVSLPGAAGVLMTDQLGIILARGDISFVDSARNTALEAGYSEALSQGFNQDQGQNGDNKQDAQQQEEQENNAVFYFDAES